MSDTEGRPVAGFGGFLDALKQLVREPAVVGAELPFFRALRRELEEAGAEVTLYEGLLVARGARPDAALVSSHVDRHGLVCTGPGEFQYAAFVARYRGDLLGDSVSEQTFQRLAARFAGRAVHAYEPWSGAYLGMGTIARSSRCERRGSVVFQVDGLERLLPGTPVAYVDRLRVTDGRLSAQLDNVLTTAMLVHAFRCGFQGTAFFTAQEEAGRSWRFLLEWFRREGTSTRRLLVLDTSPFPTVASASAYDVVLRHGDANAAFDPAAVERVHAVCRGQSVRTVFKDDLVRERNAVRESRGRRPYSLGSTELGRLVAASGGEIDGATLQVPTSGYHTASETALVNSVRRVLDVLFELTLDA